MVQSVIKYFFIFLMSLTIGYSQDIINDEDLVLINLTINEVKKKRKKEKNTKLKIINKHKNHPNYNLAIKYLNKSDTIFVRNTLLRRFDINLFKKIELNCVSLRDSCKYNIFSKKEIKQYYNILFNKLEIANYKEQFNKIKHVKQSLKQKDIKSKKVIIFNRKNKKIINTILFSKPYYTINKKYAFIIFIYKGKKRMYVFKKKYNRVLKIKWKKESLILSSII